MGRPDHAVAQHAHALVRGHRRPGLPGLLRSGRRADDRRARAAELAALVGHAGRADLRDLGRRGLASGRVHLLRNPLHAGHRLLVRIDELAGAGRGLGADGGGDRIRTGLPGILLEASGAGHHADAGPDADDPRLRLSAADSASVRVRPRRGPDCEHPLRLPSHGAEHPPRAVARAGGGDRGRADVRRHPGSALLAGARPERAAPDPAGREPDDHGGILDGDHRLDHRRNRRHRVGGALHHAQGAVRRESAGRPRDSR